MARQPTARQLYEALLDRYGEEIARAFSAAVEDLARGADLQRMIAAVEAGNIEAAIAALNLEPQAYDRVLEAIRSGYVESGTLAASRFPAVASIRFSVRNPRAERWLADRSSTLVREIIDDQRQAVRQALVAGMERGDNPRASVANIVGRLDRATGKRHGGILGLTSVQEQYLRNAQAELESGDPAQFRAYLERARRNKTFDRSVVKAINSGEPIPAETIRKAVNGYRSRLLDLRAITIGRTESLTALRAAKRESYLQAIEAGKVRDQDITRTWRDASDARVRHSHSRLDGQKVRGMAQPYVSPVTGARMLYPGDRSLGAPASEIIGCRCDEDIAINFLAAAIQ